MKHISLLAALLLSLLLVLSGGAAQDNPQSLADIARQERARKEKEAAANSAALSPPTIPPGIRYKFADRAIVEAAAIRVRKVLAPDYAGDQHIFVREKSGDRIFCGPFLWRSLSTEGEFGKKNSVPATFTFNTGGKQMKLTGQGLEGEEQIDALEAYLRKVLKDDGGFTVRALNAEELSVYWAEIAWDIEEPVFTLQSKSHLFVIQMAGVPPRVFFLDDLYGIHLNKLASEGAGEPRRVPPVSGNPGSMTINYSLRAEDLNWWRSAADRGEPLGQYNLALMYAQGVGVMKDEAEAAKWMRKAADQGLPAAEFGLGAMYQEGHGVPRSEAESIKWYRKATAQGEVRAMNNLAFLLATATDPKLRNAAEAVSFAKKAVEAEPENANSLDTLAAAYFAAGQLGQAVETEQRAVTLEPNDPSYKTALGKFQAAAARPVK
jgi:TPR repeat protein